MYISPFYACDWVDRESVNSLIESTGFSGDIDLFVLDMDGVDYWIWDALTAISPRVVVVEFMGHLGDRAITVPYDPAFEARLISLEGTGASSHDSSTSSGGMVGHWTIYAGASLMAFVNLARKRGYRLVGANRAGNNAFFVREDVGLEHFPEVDAASCANPYMRQSVMDHQWELLREFPWDTV